MESGINLVRSAAPDKHYTYSCRLGLRFFQISKMKKKIIKDKPVLSKSIAVIGLLVNLVAPGLGTIIIGKYDTGSVQLILSLIGLFFSITMIGSIIGIPLIAAMWLWALIFSIKSLTNIKK
jgi:TM2 domain-containing membrane protein YozV